MTVPIAPDGPAGREEAAAVARRGGVIAIPTDTVYGLAAARDDRAAVERLVAMKGRALEKGIAVLLVDAEQASDIALLTPLAEILGQALWPGALTLVVPARRDADVVDAIAGPDRTIGLRVPDHPCPRRIAELIGPFPATSANVTGQSEANDAPTIVRLFGDAVDLVLDGGPSTDPTPSTVVDCTTPQPRILRVGAIDERRIEGVLRQAGVGR
jgi:L-threonylcarbamoyladenylate synthase